MGQEKWILKERENGATWKIDMMSGEPLCMMKMRTIYFSERQKTLEVS